MDRKTGDMALEEAMHTVHVGRLPVYQSLRREWIIGDFGFVDDRKEPFIAALRRMK